MTRPSAGAGRAAGGPDRIHLSCPLAGGSREIRRVQPVSERGNGASVPLTASTTESSYCGWERRSPLRTRFLSQATVGGNQWRDLAAGSLSAYEETGHGDPE